MAYKKIEDTFWTDPTLRSFDVTTRYLFFYLITNPHAHYSGLYYLPKQTIQLETGLGGDPIAMGLTSLADGMRMGYDDGMSIVWVRNMLKHQIPHTNKHNALIGVSKHLKTLHNSFLIGEFLEYYNSLGIEIEYHGDVMSMGYPHPITMGYPHPVPESVAVAVAAKEEEKICADARDGSRSRNNEESKLIDDIVANLNSVLGTKYLPTSKAIRSMISARLREGHTLEDFKAVHESKNREWKNDPKMSKYLRPSTLYCASKFAGYVNQIEAPIGEGAQTGSSDEVLFRGRMMSSLERHTILKHEREEKAANVQRPSPEELAEIRARMKAPRGVEAAE